MTATTSTRLNCANPVCTGTWRGRPGRRVDTAGQRDCHECRAGAYGRASDATGLIGFQADDEIVLDLTDDAEDDGEFDATNFLLHDDFAELDQLDTDQLGAVLQAADAWGREDEFDMAARVYVTRSDADADRLDRIGRHGGGELLQAALVHPNAPTGLYLDAYKSSPTVARYALDGAAARAAAADAGARDRFLASLWEDRRLRAEVVTELYNDDVPVAGRYLAEAAAYDAGTPTTHLTDTDRYGRTKTGTIPTVEFDVYSGPWTPQAMRERAERYGQSLGDFKQAAIVECHGDWGLSRAFHISKSGKVTEIRDAVVTQAKHLDAKLAEIADSDAGDDAAEFQAAVRRERLRYAINSGNWAPVDKKDLAEAWVWYETNATR